MYYVRVTLMLMLSASKGQLEHENTWFSIHEYYLF